MKIVSEEDFPFEVWVLKNHDWDNPVNVFVMEPHCAPVELDLDEDESFEAGGKWSEYHEESAPEPEKPVETPAPAEAPVPESRPVPVFPDHLNE